MACQLPEAISKIEEILSKNGEGIASAMLSGIQINMLNEAKNNLQSAIEIRMARMQSNTYGPGSKTLEFDKKGFNGYVSIKDTGGKGTPEGDAKDKVMREVANWFIGEFDYSKINELSDGRAAMPGNSTLTSYTTLLLKKKTASAEDLHELAFHEEENGISSTSGLYTLPKNSIVMLARNGSLKGKPLNTRSKEDILEAHELNNTFVVGDMPGVDTQFIEYLNEIGASYKIYTTNEAGKEFDRKGIDGSKYRNIVETKSQNETKSVEPDVKYGSVVKTNLSSRQLELVEDAVSKSKDIGMALIKISNSSEKDEYGRTFREMSIPAKEKLEEAIKIHEKFNKTQDKKVETNKESTLSEELEYLNNKNTFKGKATQKSQVIEYVLSSGDTSFGIVHKMLDGTMLVYDTEGKFVNELSTGRFVNGSVEGRLKKSFESAITVLKNLTDEKKEKLKKRLNEEGLRNKEIKSFLKAGIDEKVRDIKISYEDLEILKKENEKLTKKTGVSIKWIENDVNADFNYNTDDNSVTYVEGFNDTITTVLQNHELKHALTFQYLKNNENDPKVAELIRGVSDFKDRLINLRARESMNYKKDDSESYISKTNDLYERVEYMLKNSTDSKISNELRQVSEIVAILSAEKDIRDQFLNEFKSEEKSKLKRLLEWIKSKLSFKDVKVEYFFSPENIVKNVDEIVKQSSKEYKKNKEYAELSEPDVDNNKYKTISKDDIEAAKDIMSNNKKECE